MTRQLSPALWLAVVLAWIGAVGAVELPACQGAAPAQKTLDNVRTTYFNITDNPYAPSFGLAYSLHKDVAFVALNTTLGVLDTSTFTPSLLHQLPMPAAYLADNQFPGALGITLTHDGRYVLVSIGPGLIVVNAATATKGDPGAVVGALNGTGGAGKTAIEVTVTSDDEYAFLSQEDGTPATKFRGAIEVFKLHKPTTKEAVSGVYIGYLALGGAVVGTSLSPNGKTMYATSEMQYAANGTVLEEGLLSIIDVEIMKKEPSKALLFSVDTGCNPVRSLVSSDGKTVWVTARASNHLLGFDAAKLKANASDALVASVQVGTLLVGLIFAKDESRIITADSNRFDYTNTTTGLSVVDVNAALGGKDAMLGRIPTGLFPREFAISLDRKTILVSDYSSLQIQALDVDTLP